MFSHIPKHASEALVVVDYQKDFVCGALGFDGAEKLDDGICAEIERVRAAHGDVIFTFDTHAETPDAYLASAEGKALPVPHCLRTSAGHDLYGKTAEAAKPQDVRVFKPSFGSPMLAEILQKRGYTKITFVGLVSHICVISNAMLAKAFCPEAEICVIAALTAAADENLHKAALDVMRSVQIHVL